MFVLDEVYLLYEMCAYEKYIYNNSRWCNLMSDADRRVLEYGQDLEVPWLKKIWDY